MIILRVLKKFKRSLMLLVENFFDKILLSVNNFVGCMISWK